MNIPVNAYTWIMACLPIILLVVLMIKFHWGAAEAAAIGLLVSVITGLTVYKGSLPLIAGEAAKGVWNALVILLIIWTAILLYQVGAETNAFLVIKNGMGKMLPNELLLVLALGWVFESFLQGITGFGVPVAVGAPLLIGIGVSPIWAVIIPLLGQAWGNTFGTLGAAWDSLAMTSGMKVGSGPYFQTALWTAIFLFAWDIVTGLLICWFYGKGKAVKKGFVAVMVLAVIQGGGEVLLSQVNTTLCCFIPSVISLVVLMLMGRMKMYSERWEITDSPIMNRKTSSEGEEEKAPEGMTLLQAFLPYILLSALTLIVLLVGPINQVLGSFKIGFAFPETVTGYGFVNAASDSYSPIAPCTHASMFLFISAMVGMIYYKSKGRVKEGGVGRIFVKSIEMTMPSGSSVGGLVIMTRVMGVTGQTAVMAQGIANVLGKAYLILAPFVGLLGTFMTGSNMSSNILFGDFQVTTAKLLSVKEFATLSAQTAGGAIGAAVSPSKIILGTTTAGILGKEGDVLKKVMVSTIPAVIVIGLVVFLVQAL